MIPKYPSVFKKEAIGDRVAKMKLITLAMLLVVATYAAAQSVGGGAPLPGNDPEPSFSQQRHAMVARLNAQGAIDGRIANALAAVPREQFVPRYLRQLAYEDSSLPIGGGNTLPSPSDFALSLAALDVRPTDRVLLIGSADAYAAALLSRLAAHVEDVELDAADTGTDHTTLSSLGYSNITLAGPTPASSLPSLGPYNEIFVDGALSGIPSGLTTLLAPGGRLVAPLRDPSGIQMLVALQEQSDGAMAVRAVGRAFFAPIKLPIGSY